MIITGFCLLALTCVIAEFEEKRENGNGCPFDDKSIDVRGDCPPVGDSGINTINGGDGSSGDGGSADNGAGITKATFIYTVPAIVVAAALA